MTKRNQSDSAFLLKLAQNLDVHRNQLEFPFGTSDVDRLRAIANDLVAVTETREDGAVVRKDRWESGFRNIATILKGPRKEFEIHEIVAQVQQMFDAKCGAFRHYCRHRMLHELAASDRKFDPKMAEYHERKFQEYENSYPDFYEAYARSKKDDF